MISPLPDSIRDENQLEDLLSEPTPGVIATLGRLQGDLILLGVAGKMGPTLARMARRASDLAGVQRRVIGVARFSTPGLRERLERHGIQTHVCDLLDPAQVESLPEAPNIVALLGMKFGSTGQEALTWANNAHLPAVVCRRYPRSRIVAFSTGNVYGLSPICLGGSLESDPLHPVGEYAWSSLGRERMYEHFSRTLQIPMALLRLNYAHELRYGVMVDIGLKVWTGQPIDLSMGHFNVIWQGDANAMSLQAFDHLAVPPRVLNLAGPEMLSVRRVATEFGRLFGVTVTFRGEEADDAFLSNAQLSHRLFGYPRVPVQQMMHWVADWIQRDGPLLGKPTHFENRTGKY